MKKNGESVLAEMILAVDWQALKNGYEVGDFVMPCCPSPAIPKTSPNGRHFFAHYVDECTSAPETQWHLEGKALITATLATLGHVCTEEVPGISGEALWRADTYFEFEGRRIVIELQRSYQHLDDYFSRQERYAKAGIECYWLIRPEPAHTLMGSLARFRIKRDSGGKLIPGFPFVAELPMAILETGNEPYIKFAKLLRATPKEWLQSLLEKRFHWSDGVWFIKA